MENLTNDELLIRVRNFIRIDNVSAKTLLTVMNGHNDVVGKSLLWNLMVEYKINVDRKLQQVELAGFKLPYINDIDVPRLIIINIISFHELNEVSEILTIEELVDQVFDYFVNTGSNRKLDKIALYNVCNGGHSCLGKALIWDLMIDFNLEIDYCNSMVKQVDYLGRCLVTSPFIGKSDISKAIIQTINDIVYNGE